MHGLTQRRWPVAPRQPSAAIFAAVFREELRTAAGLASESVPSSRLPTMASAA